MTSNPRQHGRPNRELVVYGLYLAGGASSFAHTEDVALECWKRFQDSFSWTKYPQYPDKDIVRVALTDARKPKYGALVAGRVEGAASDAKDSAGWRLTPAGLQWISDHQAEFDAGESGREPKKHRQLSLKRLKDVTGETLFQRFLTEGNEFSPSLGEMARFLKCRVDANAQIWDRRLNDLKRLAIETNSADTLGRFVDACSASYRNFA